MTYIPGLKVKLMSLWTHYFTVANSEGHIDFDGILH
jgi:hypothetical protein